MGNQSSSRRASSFTAEQPHRSSIEHHTNRDKQQHQHHRHKSDVDNYFDYSMDNKKVTGIISNHHVREHKRHGVVSLKVVNQHAATANLRGIENTSAIRSHLKVGAVTYHHHIIDFPMCSHHPICPSVSSSYRFHHLWSIEL